MYCPNCNILTNEEKCPVCKGAYLRDPDPEDYCFLVEKELIWASSLEDLLKDNGIPCVTRNVLGAGLAAKIGSAMERKRFFVPYSHYSTAKELAEEFFTSDFLFEE